MKIDPATPSIVSALIALSALALFFHTSASRHQAADPGSTTSSAGRSFDRHSQDSGEGPDRTTRFRLPPAGKDREAAIATRVSAALAIGQSMNRTRALLALMKDFTNEDFEIAMNARPTPNIREQNPDFQLILSEWVSRDPQAAMAYDKLDEPMRLHAYGEWANGDPEAALRWMENEITPELQGNYLGLIMTAMAKEDPQQAIARMDLLEPDAVGDALKALLFTSGQNVTPAILDWIETQPDPAVQAEALKAIFSGLTSDRPQEKFDLLLRYPEAIEGLDLYGPFRNWTLADPTAASAAIDQLPAGDTRESAIRGTVLQLLYSNQVEAAAGMIANHPDEIPESAIAQGITDLFDGHPAEALEQTHLIKDPQTHEDTYANLLGDWLIRDAAAARQWMSSHEVPPAVRKRIEKAPTANSQGP